MINSLKRKYLIVRLKIKRFTRYESLSNHSFDVKKCTRFLGRNRRCYLLLELVLRGDIRSRIPCNKNESAGDEYKFEYKFDADTARTGHEKSIYAKYSLVYIL